MAKSGGSDTYATSDETLDNFINTLIPGLTDKISNDPGYIALQGFTEGVPFVLGNNGVSGYGELLPGSASEYKAPELQKAFTAYCTGLLSAVGGYQTSLASLKKDLLTVKTVLDDGEDMSSYLASTLMSDLESILSGFNGGTPTTTTPTPTSTTPTSTTPTTTTPTSTTPTTTS
ncbi:hypothetical protein [Actinacidiphila yeochonensis]|uniref:hypothetical protein n=1 Tax=Actinacidiphila yeochonensis TaxID=89050 RepID=UPI00056907CE|nr:hypothetical protein [Actinacidiphila yeochonensis]